MQITKKKTSRNRKCCDRITRIATVNEMVKTSGWTTFEPECRGFVKKQLMEKTQTKKKENNMMLTYQQQKFC